MFVSLISGFSEIRKSDIFLKPVRLFGKSLQNYYIFLKYANFFAYFSILSPKLSTILPKLAPDLPIWHTGMLSPSRFATRR